MSVTPPPPPSTTGSSPDTPEQPQEPAAGSLGSYQITSAQREKIPEELVTEVFNDLEAEEPLKAEQTVREFKATSKNPKDCTREIVSLIATTRAIVRKGQIDRPLPTQKKLLDAIKKVELDWKSKKQQTHSFFILRGAKLLKKAASLTGDISTFVKELAVANLPESQNYILESAWDLLFGEIKHLLLAGTIFLPRPYQALLRALQNNSNLKSLSLSACKIKHEAHEEKMGDIEAEALTKALEQHPSIERLYFSYHNIGEHGAASLARLANKLLCLNLKGNGISDNGGKTIAAVLANPDALLQELYLEMNQIGDQGAVTFGHSLKTNRDLQLLVLWGNEIEDEGSRALRESVLKGRVSFRRLDMGNNRLSEEELQSLQRLQDPRIVF